MASVHNNDEFWYLLTLATLGPSVVCILRKYWYLPMGTNGFTGRSVTGHPGDLSRRRRAAGQAAD
jgi:hypothetical protein